MSSLSSPTCSFIPKIVAALAICVLPELRALGLQTPTTAAVLDRLGVCRSTAYELAGEIRDAIEHVPRPPGRPPKPKSRSAPAAHEITAGVRDYLFDHPGAVSAGRLRRTYSDGFRCFVATLYDEYAAALSLIDFADAVGVPYDTIRDWTGGDRGDTGGQLDVDASVDPERGINAQILALWRNWQGKLPGFQRALHDEHRIDVTLHTLRELLRVTGQRKTNAASPKPDPEAIRGALERFFPGAQWVGDGKVVVIRVGDESFAFLWELIVDAFDGAHVGFDVRDAEDAEGLINAVEHGIRTTGEAPPLSLLVDNKPSNRAAVVAETLDEHDVLGMTSTLFRPENKASVEGAFGLFSQTMPPLQLSQSPSPRERAREVLRHVLHAYCAGRNHAPRAARNGKSAAQTYLDAAPTEPERAAARQRLREIEERTRARNDRDARRADPVCRSLLEHAFARADLSDPEGLFIPRMAAYGLAAVIEGIAAFERRHAKKPPLEVPERYLLGTIRNIAHRDDIRAIYEATVQLRLQAHDLMLEPLLEHDTERRSKMSTKNYFDATLKDALDVANAMIDRTFYRTRVLDTLAQMPRNTLRNKIRSAVRRVSLSYAIPLDERSYFVARLAELAATTKANC